MQVSVETTSGLERRMTVEIPEERIESEVQNRLRNLARTTRIKGFRPGKAPMKVIARQYGLQVRQEVLGEVVQSSFYEAVSAEQLRPAGAPRIEFQDSAPGSVNLAYTAVFEVMPEVTVADLSTLSLAKPVADVGDADVDKMMETLRKQRASWSAVERPAEEGDRLYIDFKGTINGEPFAGGEGNNVPLTLGGGRMVPGFEEGLVGASAGEERTLDITFPDDYGNKELTGKAAQFAIKVNSVEAASLPELNDEFAAQFNVQEGGIEALRKEVRENMERELRQRLRAQVKQLVMDRLLDSHAIDIPAALIQQESQSLADQLRQNMRVPQGKEGPAIESSMFSEQARKRVTLGLIISEIVSQNGLKASPERVRVAIEELAASYEEPAQVVAWYLSDRRRSAEVEAMVLEDEVVDWVLGNLKVEETPTSFDAIMNPNG